MRLIDGDALNAYLQDEYHGAISDSELKVYQIMRLIDNAPTVDPVKRGEWVQIENTQKHYCSECGVDFDLYAHLRKSFNCCPSCGARMDGEAE